MSGSDFVHNQAPESMTPLVQVLFVSTAVIGSILGIVLGRTSSDPDVVDLYTSLALAMLVATVLF